MEDPVLQHHPKGFWFRHDAIMLSDASAAIVMIVLASALVLAFAVVGARDLIS